MKSYCPICGTEILDNYTFCVNCGSAIRKTESSLIETQLKTHEISSSAHRMVVRNRRIIILGGSLFFIIILVILISFGFIWFAGENTYEYAGTVDYYVKRDIEVSKLTLEVNNYRSINISIIPDLDHYFHAKIYVFARNDYNEERVDTFKESIFKDEIMLVFQPENYWAEFSSPEYEYELQIYIACDLISGLNIDCPYGNVLLSAYSANVSFLWLDSSSGNVSAEFIDTSFIGNNESHYAMDSTYGHVMASFINSSFSNNETRISLFSMEEKVDLFVEQMISDENSFHHAEFQISADNIVCRYQISSEIGVGIKIIALSENVNTFGSISGVDFPYYRENYSTATLRFLFDIYCSDGTVTISGQ